MKSLLAHIANPAETADRRRMARRTLRLDATAHAMSRASSRESAVVIRNLSRTGLLIESDAAFAVGETFLLILPEIGATPARVIRKEDGRKEGGRFGCEFLSPVPASAISAAMLKAPHDEDAGAMAEAMAWGETAGPAVKRRTSALLFTAVTLLFTAAAILLLFALASLTISSD